MGVVNHFLNASTSLDSQGEEQCEVVTSQLVMTWITHAQNGFKIDRSTHVDISRMSNQDFKSAVTARAAVVQKASELGIPKELVLFPQCVHQY